MICGSAVPPAGSIGNADSACQSEALAAGLVNSSRFRAFLATTSASAMSRFDLTGTAWVRTDGVQVAATPGDLATDNMLAPVTVQADGATYAGPYARVWGGATSATVAGTTAETCSNWSATSGATGTSGIVGYGNAGQFYWNSNWACTDRSLRVLCLEN